MALDRFIPVNLLVGAILAAAPLAFAVLYTRWTAHNPAATADATLTLPTSVQAVLVSPADAVLRKGTVVRVGGMGESLDKLAIAHLEPGTVAAARSTRIRLAAGTVIMLPAGTAVTARPTDADVRWRVPGWGIRRWFRRTPLTAGVTLTLPEGVRATLEDDVYLPVDQPAPLGGQRHHPAAAPDEGAAAGWEGSRVGPGRPGGGRRADRRHTEHDADPEGAGHVSR